MLRATSWLVCGYEALVLLTVFQGSDAATFEVVDAQNPSLSQDAAVKHMDLVSASNPDYAFRPTDKDKEKGTCPLLEEKRALWQYDLVLVVATAEGLPAKEGWKPDDGSDKQWWEMHEAFKEKPHVYVEIKVTFAGNGKDVTARTPWRENTHDASWEDDSAGWAWHCEFQPPHYQDEPVRVGLVVHFQDKDGEDKIIATGEQYVNPPTSHREEFVNYSVTLDCETEYKTTDPPLCHPNPKVLLKTVWSHDTVARDQKLMPLFGFAAVGICIACLGLVIFHVRRAGNDLLSDELEDIDAEEDTENPAAPVGDSQQEGSPTNAVELSRMSVRKSIATREANFDVARPSLANPYGDFPMEGAASFAITPGGSTQVDDDDK